MTSDPTAPATEGAATVRALLERAGIRPTTAWDLQALVAVHAGLRASAELLHAVDEARYEEPALSFDPTRLQRAVD